ncbi:MAG: DUF1800 family protein [Bdellovibrionota bacterium]
MKTRQGLVYVLALIFLLPGICHAQAKGLLTFEDGEAGAWNGFFPLNVIECLNSGPDTADLRITAYKLDGTTLDTRDISIAKDATVHTLVHELRNPTTGETTANSYGLFTVKKLNEAQHVQVSCLSVFYSIAPGSTVPSYAFAKRVEKVGGNKNRYLLLNSLSRGGVPTYNWVSAMNTGTNPVTVMLELYDAVGSAVGQQAVVLAPGERRDVGYHETEALRLLKIYKSDPNIPVQTFSTRINGTNFAFSTDSTTGSCSEPVQLSTTANGKSWAVYANPNETAAKGNLVIRDQSGNVITERSINLAPKSQASVYLNPIVDPSNVGAIGTVTIDCEDRSQPFIYQVEHFGYPVGKGFEVPSIWAYANQANGAPTAGPNDSLVAFTNTFLGDGSVVTANWTNVANSGTGPAVVQFNVHAASGAVLRSQSYALAPNGSVNLDSHVQLGANQVGTSSVTTSDAAAALSGQHLRVFYRQGQVATILVTPLTLISSAAPLDVEFGGIASLRPYRNRLTDNEIFRAFNTFGMGAPPSQIASARSGGLESLAEIILSQPLAADVEQRAMDAAALSYASLTNPTRTAWTLASLQNWLITEFRYASPARAQSLLMFFEWFAQNLSNYSGVAETQHFIDEHRKVLSDLALGNDPNFEHAMIRLVEGPYFGIWLNLTANRIIGGNQDGTREFVELATMGPVDAVYGTPNYGQAHIEASRLALTGFFQSTVTLGDGTRKTLVGYSPQDHYTGVTDLYPDTPYWAHGAFNYSQVVEHTLYNAPPSSHFVASNLITNLMRPDPDANVTLSLASELVNNAYDLRPSIEKLVKSSYAFAPRSSAKRCEISPIEAAMRVARTLNIPVTKSSTYTTLRQMLSDTSQLLGSYPTVFGGVGSCGKFQGGVISQGDRWNEASARLYLSNGITNFLNGAVQNEGFQMSSLLPPGVARPTGRQMVDYLTSLFGLSWSEQEKAIGEQYFNTKRTNGVDRTVPFDAGVAATVNMKVAGFIADFIAVHPQFLTK